MAKKEKKDMLVIPCLRVKAFRELIVSVDDMRMNINVSFVFYRV